MSTTELNSWVKLKVRLRIRCCFRGGHDSWNDCDGGVATFAMVDLHYGGPML